MIWFRRFFQPFRITLGKGTPVRDLAKTPSNLPINPAEIKSIEDLKRALQKHGGGK